MMIGLSGTVTRATDRCRAHPLRLPPCVLARPGETLGRRFGGACSHRRPCVVPPGHMNASDLSALDLSDREELRVALTALLRAANQQGSSIPGGYRVEIEDGEQGFGVEIYRVSTPDE